MKELSNTKVTVRLRKIEGRKEWYVYIESYPVVVPGKKSLQRMREYLSRSVTTINTSVNFKLQFCRKPIVL
ncbi:MAG TPA: hypothetical protein VFC67_28560 [Prolixibacteraceae bacterium]|nr:hypothetical protein [Prolixibacteraceae bacterium]